MLKLLVRNANPGSMQIQKMKRAVKIVKLVDTVMIAMKSIASHAQRDDMGLKRGRRRETRGAPPNVVKESTATPRDKPALIMPVSNA